MYSSKGEPASEPGYLYLASESEKQKFKYFKSGKTTSTKFQNRHYMKIKLQLHL